VCQALELSGDDVPMVIGMMKKALESEVDKEDHAKDVEVRACICIRMAM
jgi:hypothetical protein